MTLTITTTRQINLNPHELRALAHIRRRGAKGTTLAKLSLEYRDAAYDVVYRKFRLPPSLLAIEPSKRVAWRACLFARHSLRKLRKLKLIRNVPRSGVYTITARGKAVR